MTSIEAKVSEYAKRTGMEPNGIEWYVLENAHENIVDDVDAIGFMSITDFNTILDKHTSDVFKNPEWSAVRAEAIETLKFLGYTINDNGVWNQKS